MLRREKGGISWLEFEIFEGFSCLSHALFLRGGGNSIHPFDSLNFSVHVGDCAPLVDSNRSKALNVLDIKDFARTSLVHGTSIVKFDGPSREGIVQADGLSTCVRGLGLLSTFADCQCSFIFDPVSCAVANVHAGWRGCVNGIYGLAVEHMVREYGSKRGDLLAGIGPGLCTKHAEFVNYEREIPSVLHGYKRGGCFFDFWSMARDQLVDSGVLPNRIEVAELCTFCDEENFFSNRRDKVTGRHGGVIVIR